MEWQPIETLPYDETVLVAWSDGFVRQEFWYDQTLDEWRRFARRRDFQTGELSIFPYCWMSIPPLPEPPK